MARGSAAVTISLPVLLTGAKTVLDLTGPLTDFAGNPKRRYFANGQNLDKKQQIATSVPGFSIIGHSNRDRPGVSMGIASDTARDGNGTAGVLIVVLMADESLVFIAQVWRLDAGAKVVG